MATSQKQYKIVTLYQCMTSMLSYVLHRIALLSMTLSFVEGHFIYFKYFKDV